METARLSTMDALTKVVGALTAVIALVTAYLTYRLKRFERRAGSLQGTDSQTSLRLLEIDYGPVKQNRLTKAKWLMVKWAMVPLALLSALMTAQGVYVFLWRSIQRACSAHAFLEHARSPM